MAEKSIKKGKGEGVKTKDDKNRQLSMEDVLKKSVTFAAEEKKPKKGKEGEDLHREMEELKKRVLEEVRKIRNEKLGLEKVKLEIDASIKEINERVEQLEIKFQELEEREREWEKQASISASGASGANDTAGGDTGSVWSVRSGMSGTSAMSRVSLSDREIARMKKMVNEQDKIERRNNIVIRGVEPTGENLENLKDWVENFVKEKLDIAIKVVNARMSGRVIVAKIEGEGKEEIMRNKSKLRGTRIFIENDLNIEDRRKQEEIHRWVKEKKGEGWNVKSGTGKVFFKGVWRKWDEKTEITKEMELSQEKTKDIEQDVRESVPELTKNINNKNLH